MRGAAPLTSRTGGGKSTRDLQIFSRNASPGKHFLAGRLPGPQPIVERPTGIRQVALEILLLSRFRTIHSSFGAASSQNPAQKISLHYITPYGVIMNMDQLTNVLTAISHPTRRAIIGQLAHGPARFLDVAKPFDTALNAVSKHLKLLERAGLIERRKQGREVYISFRGEPLREVAGWVHEYERFWNERLDQFALYFKDKKKNKERK